MAARSIQVDTMPREMRERPQWVCWKEVIREGKATKVPINPKTGGTARSDRPSTWGTLEQAVEALGQHPDWAGIGFMFSQDDPYTGIDLDKCLNPDGTLKEWARPWVALLDSYTEVTPSGTGLHILIEAVMPEKARHKVLVEDGAIECYDRLRYFTMTGQHWEGTPTFPGCRQQSFDAFYAQVFPAKSAPAADPAPVRVTSIVSVDDRALLDLMLGSKQGAEIERLWRGDKSAYTDTDGRPDDSSADLALCNHLAFWTGKDAARMDRLFRQSGCYREKWERADYRNRTIGEALAGTTEVYEPPGPRLSLGFQERAERAARKNSSQPAEIPELYRASDLQGKVLPPLHWLVQGFIPEGVTMIVAHSKTGKTFLAEDVAVAVALGSKAWGKIEVEQGRVIYLDTEGSRRRVQKRLFDLLGGQQEWPEELLLTHECITLTPEGLAIVEKMVEQHGPRGFFIDTFNASRPARRPNGDLVKEDYDLIRALRQIGEKSHCGMVVLHHASMAAKSDTVNAGAGTHGLAAAANAVLTFQRARGEHDAIMHVAGNDLPNEGQRYFTRDQRTGFWTLQGSVEQFMSSQFRQDIFNALSLKGDMTPTEMGRAFGYNTRSKEYERLKKTLRRMWFDHDLVCMDGKYSIPTTRN